MSSPDDATQTMIRNLEAKTGKTLDQWVKIARAAKLSKHGEILKLLKTEHGLTHGYANLVTLKSLEGDLGEPAGDELVAAQYAGAKAGLRPIYDRLLAAVRGFGTDVEVAPKKAYVSLRRSKQFAIVQPSTAARIDVGVNLKGTPPAGRLEASGTFSAMVSHRVRVEKMEDVDRELLGWLRKAYDAA